MTHPKIEEFTISLHCGCSRKIVNNQMKALEPLEEEYNITWNNRIDRQLHYDSYSELVNHAVETSPTEFVILINDRTHPKPHEVKRILYALENGYAMATQYSVGFVGFSKELFRKIGCYDPLYYGGGWEDDDFVLRLKLADLAYYESCESNYDYDWKTPLQPQDSTKGEKSGAFFKEKWKISPGEIKKVLPEPKYDYNLGDPRPDISDSWMPWSESVLGVDFKKNPEKQGPSRTHHFLIDAKHDQPYRRVVDGTV
jgi:hypothetical protein